MMAISSLAHSITAKSWLVADGFGQVIQGENTKEVRSIASITKLMTTMVVLDAKQNLNETIGKFTRQQLIQLAIVHSDNKAAKELCDNYPGGERHCVREMNRKAKSLGLQYTQFTDSTGLSVFNLSNAEELIRIVFEASKYTEIIEASKMSEVKIRLNRKWLIFKNTNPIIGKNHNIIISKTGFINASGGCIVMLMDTDVGKRVVVILGSRNTHTRIPEAEFISKL